MIKTYVLDTNVLMSTEGRVLFGFEDNNVIITHTTLEELDKFKMASGERGYQAREAIRTIKSITDSAQEGESITTGIRLPNTGVFRVNNNFNLTAKLPEGWDLKSPDNCILSTCKSLSGNAVGKGNTILITNDISMTLKAQIIGVPVQGYKNDNISSLDSMYTGRGEVLASMDCINELYRNGSMPLPASEKYIPRKYYHVHDMGSHSALCYVDDYNLKLIKTRKQRDVYGISPKNLGQEFAMHALMAPASEIPLVILKGPAGSGKTLLSLAAGLDKTYHWDSKDRVYNSMVITRSNTLSDEDLGFLPGSLEDKMTPLLSPFMDNLRYLLGKDMEDRSQVNMQMEDIIESGIIEITSLAYIRGRSLANTYLIVDETQNTTRTQISTIVTRMGEGSKLVILGDPNQIDNPKLDRQNNGLVYLSEKFKDSPLCAEVTFEESESVRSALAKEAIVRLNL